MPAPDPVEQPLAAASHNADLLTRAIGPTVGYHVSQCRNGGYVVLVAGEVHSAHSALVDAIAAMGSVAAGRYGETAIPPEQASDVTPHIERMPRHLERAANGGGRTEEPERDTSARISRFPATVSLVMMTLAAGAAYVWGP